MLLIFHIKSTFLLLEVRKMFHLHYNVGFSFRHLLSVFQHHIGMFRLLFDSIYVCIETQKPRPISWSFIHILTKEYESSESPFVISCRIHTNLRNLDKNDVNRIIFLFIWKTMMKNNEKSGVHRFVCEYLTKCLSQNMNNFVAIAIKSCKSAALINFNLWPPLGGTLLR